jgi:hypothetical protein
MAKRPIFIAESHGPNLVRVQSIEFTWFAGMAMSRRQMSMRSLHQAAQALHPEARILEVSRMSDDPLGEKLSAFNLTLNHPESARNVPLECVFQSSKVFERGGPFQDLLDASPAEAKRDVRLQNSGSLTAFQYNGEYWPKEPLTAFYDWIYIHALCKKPELAEPVLNYDIFTDIAFNPTKSINCQAGAVALFVALVRAGKLDAALSSRDAFLNFEQGATTHEDADGGQRSLF